VRDEYPATDERTYWEAEGSDLGGPEPACFRHWPLEVGRFADGARERWRRWGGRRRKSSAFLPVFATPERRRRRLSSSAGSLRGKRTVG